MARNSKPLRLVVHTPERLNHTRMEAEFDAFYLEQVCKRLENSELNRKEKAKILELLIAVHAEKEPPES